MVVEDKGEFNYDWKSEKGPSRWGEIRPEWSMCGHGTMHSPIDLLNKRVELVSHLGRRKRSYKRAYAKRERNICSTPSYLIIWVTPLTIKHSLLRTKSRYIHGPSIISLLNTGQPKGFTCTPVTRKLKLVVAAMETQAMKAVEDGVLKKGIAEFYDESSSVWEDIWGDHMHHGFYNPDSTVDVSGHRAAQIRMIDEALRFAGVSGRFLSLIHSLTLMQSARSLLQLLKSIFKANVSTY